MFLRNAWYMAGWSRDFGSEAVVHFTILGEPLVIYRKQDGTLAVLQDRCPHRLAPLSVGQREGDDLRCMYHGLKFASDGRCVEIPGQDRIPPSLKVRSYPALERHSGVWIWMGEAGKADEALLPDFVGIDHPGWSMKPGRMDYRANYQLINDNLLDLSHIFFVHKDTFGAGDANLVRRAATYQPQLTPLPRGVRFERRVENGQPPPYLKGKVEAGDTWHSYDFLAPGVFLMSYQIYPPGTFARGAEAETPPSHAHYTCQAITPLTETTTSYFFAFGPSSRQPELTDLFYDLGVAAFNEDRAMIEAQQRVIDQSPGVPMIPLGMDGGASLFRSIMQRMMTEEAKPSTPAREPALA